MTHDPGGPQEFLRAASFFVWPEVCSLTGRPVGPVKWARLVLSPTLWTRSPGMDWWPATDGTAPAVAPDEGEPCGTRPRITRSAGYSPASPNTPSRPPSASPTRA